MRLKVTARKVHREVLTKNWKYILVGMTITWVLSVYMFWRYGLGLKDVHFIPGLVGGLVIGVLNGRNRVDVAAMGMRAGVFGAILGTFTFSAFIFVIWFQASGQAYYQFTFAFFTMLAFIYMAIYGVMSGIGAALGTSLRRIALPQYNPSEF